MSPYSVQGKVRALKAFASWLFNEGYTSDDAHIEEGYLKVAGKRSKERVVPIGVLAHKILWRYIIHFRQDDSIEADNYIFLTLEVKPLCPNAIKLMLKRWGKKAGVERLQAYRL